jgi:hypothetical protein
MVKIEKYEYAGWKNCCRLSNGLIELIATTEVGPRVIRFGFIGGVNELFEQKEDLGKTGGDTWRLFGGHRLWHAPEDPVRTYIPDNSPCEVTLLDDGVILTAPPEVPAGVQKTMEIRMSPDSARVSLLHTIKNSGLWPITLSSWAVTMMAPNGTAIMPLPVRIEWPKVLLPTHSIAFWSYTRMSDSRFTWGDQHVLLRQEPIRGKEQKIGFVNTEGWAAYRNEDRLFIKTFDFFPGKVYPDRNSNFECFTNHDVLELETLGPIEKIEPGETVSHREGWQLFKDMKFALNDGEIRDTIPALLKP